MNFDLLLVMYRPLRLWNACEAQHRERKKLIDIQLHLFFCFSINPLDMLLIGAYDTKACHAAIKIKGAIAFIPPREGAAFWDRGHPRNLAVGIRLK